MMRMAGSEEREEKEEGSAIAAVCAQSGEHRGPTLLPHLRIPRRRDS
jgi:hypothetical protein